jgi:hypothetical protein
MFFLFVLFFMGFEVFVAVKIYEQTVVFWVVTTYSVVDSYRFGGICCLHLKEREKPIWEKDRLC